MDLFTQIASGDKLAYKEESCKYIYSCGIYICVEDTQETASHVQSAECLNSNNDNRSGDMRALVWDTQRQD